MKKLKTFLKFVLIYWNIKERYELTYFKVEDNYITVDFKKRFSYFPSTYLEFYLYFNGTVWSILSMNNMGKSFFYEDGKFLPEDLDTYQILS